MNFKIGNYIECKMKKNNITKIGLYNQLKDVFYNNEKEYIGYKGFASKFYTRFYAEDLFKISYLLGIDLNRMRDEVINLKKRESSKILDIALSKSKYVENYSGNYSKWFDIEEDFVYIVWFKIISLNDLEYTVEMYDLKEDKIKDITFLTCKAVSKMDKDWEDKNLDEKLNAIKLCNKKVYDKLI